jgi:hypothetical protein
MIGTSSKAVCQALGRWEIESEIEGGWMVKPKHSRLRIQLTKAPEKKIQSF